MDADGNMMEYLHLIKDPKYPLTAEKLLDNLCSMMIV